MTPTLEKFLELVGGRRGHFRLESGHHGAVWLDLDALFARPAAVGPFVDVLTARLRVYAPEVVCGPLLGGAILAQWLARDLGTAFCFTGRESRPRAPGLYAASYRLPAAFRSHVAGRRVVIVDDVVSAGSSVRATYAELQHQGAIPVAVGALLVLGDAATAYFSDRRLVVEGVVRDDYVLWPPGDCPRCAEGMPLEDMTATTE